MRFNFDENLSSILEDDKEIDEVSMIPTVLWRDIRNSYFLRCPAINHRAHIKEITKEIFPTRAANDIRWIAHILCWILDFVLGFESS
uniref:Uncharacterized protein n=1 Tax=Ochrobactrum phage ORM_20 TaxID=2985243 RepID=A0A9N6WV77_9VIRU|nr:hypothetical protein ORM20_00006 [Ochrobactrum phage ORM_20]